jgi:hypothetical protein
MEKTMMQALKDAQNVQPFAKIGDKDVVTFEQYQDLAVLDSQFNAVPGMPTLDKNGMPCKSYTARVAYNPDVFYDNRYRKVKDSILVVTDFRAISEQSTGRVYASQIPAVSFVRKDGKLAYDKTVLVSDKEFLEQFTHKLSNEAMAEIRMVLAENAVPSDLTADELPI